MHKELAEQRYVGGVSFVTCMHCCDFFVSPGGQKSTQEETNPQTQSKRKVGVRNCFLVNEKPHWRGHVCFEHLLNHPYIPTHCPTQSCKPPRSGYSYSNDLAFHSAKKTEVETNMRKKKTPQRKVEGFFFLNAEWRSLVIIGGGEK